MQKLVGLIGVIVLPLCVGNSNAKYPVQNKEACVPPPVSVSHPRLLGKGETCTTRAVKLSCKEGWMEVCLPYVSGELAVGCAPNICINGRGCAEWNTNGSVFLINVRDNACKTCPHTYELSNSTYVERCQMQDTAQGTTSIPMITESPTTSISTNSASGTSAGFCIPLLIWMMFLIIRQAV